MLLRKHPLSIIGGLNLDIKQLRSYVAIVDYRNFSKAAAKLNISQASVSTHLIQLEKELGVTLLNRNTKTMEVTDVGWAVYKYASQILEMERCVIESCSAGTRRIIRVGASAIPAAYILPEILGQYGELFSHDLLKVSQCPDREVVTGVQEGRFDVGLISYPVKREGLKCVPLCSDPPVLIAPVTEWYQRMLNHKNPVPVLLQKPIVLREDGKYLDDILVNLGLDKRDLQIIARVKDPETVKNMVAGGMGVSVISEIAAKDFIQSRKLLKFDLSKYQDAESVCLIYPEHDTPRNGSWNFIDYLNCMYR